MDNNWTLANVERILNKRVAIKTRSKLPPQTHIHVTRANAIIITWYFYHMLLYNNNLVIKNNLDINVYESSE